MAECRVCGGICDGKLIVRDANVLEPLTVCCECLNDWANGEWGRLGKKLERKEKLFKNPSNP